ncbi:MAG TPA: PAS domain S-box protein [Bacteroidales bacterium]|nr:PAS domain S-box protein [Bacteroidales bacterium]
MSFKDNHHKLISRFIFDNSSDAIIVFNDSGILDFNKSALILFDCDSVTLKTKKLHELSAAFQSDGSSSANKAEKLIEAAFSGEEIQSEWIFEGITGKKINADIILSGIADKSGGKSIIWVIKEKKNPFASFIDRTGLSEIILNIIPGLFFVYDITEGIENAILLRFNSKWYKEKLGYRSGELPPGYPYFFFSHGELERILNVYKELYLYKFADFEVNTIHKEGYDIPYLYVANYFSHNDRTYFIGFGIDISERKYAEHALMQSEEYFKNIFNTSSDGILVIDLDFKLLNANDAIFRMFDYKFEDIVFQNILDFIPESSHSYLKDRLRSLVKKEGVPPFELEIKKRTGEIVPIEIRSIIIEYGERKGILTTVRDLTERKMLEKKIFNSEIHAEEKEKERFAKELHDGLGPILSTCKIYLHSLNEMLEKQEDVLKVSGRALTLIDDALGSIKEISNNLSPHVLRNFGLVQAIISFTHNLESISSLKFEVHYNFERRLGEIIEFTVYRVLTELINNTLKYAEATLVIISIQLEEPLLKVSYRDNGKGFDLATVQRSSKGFGLNNIETRISKFNGSFSYDTSPGDGVEVRFTLNYTDPE